MVALVPRKTIRVAPIDRLRRGVSRLPVARDGPLRCRRKFRRVFPGGFADPTYIAWERAYKWEAHERWQELLGPATFRELRARGGFEEIAARAVKIEARTNLLFSFEKMALRDAVRGRAGARAFALGLYSFLHGPGGDERRFEQWAKTIAALPRRQTRVLTWPVATVFGFIAQPRRHIFIKPNVTRIAAREYGFDLRYSSQVTYPTYANVLRFARAVRRDVADLGPRDLIDVQSFIWVQGSDEYGEWKS